MLPELHTVRVPLAILLSACLLCLRLGCVAICSNHLEEASKTGSHNLAVDCTIGSIDVTCPIATGVTSALPERSFVSPIIVGAVNLNAPIFSLEFINDGRDSRPKPYHPSLAPFERNSVLRI